MTRAHTRSMVDRLLSVLQVLIYEDNAARFSMLFDDDGEQFRHVIGEFAAAHFSDAAAHTVCLP